ncbi:MAG: YfhO family protein, partial [Candidatus Omnitrophica bacterium]|nr:YfhO family protein [Candidatus Omnitrophota bacterium]
MRNGIFPLWNPFIFSGVPHFALQQSVVIYPLSIIYYILPFACAFNIFLIMHVFLAGVFTYLLGRRWGLRESSSILSAVILMFSGYVVSVINLATTLSSIIWLPLILYFFDKGLTRQKIKYLFISSIFLAVMFFGGEPSIFYSTLWVLLFYSLFFRLGNKDKSSTKVFIYYILTAGVAILLTAVQLLPFLELMKLTDRQAFGGDYKYLTCWSLPLRDTFNFFIPFLTRTDFSKESYWKEQNWLIIMYVGIFTLILLIFAFMFRKDWRARFLYFTGLLSLLVSYGNYTPFYYLIYKIIPGFQLVRYPVRFLYITTFALAMLSGVGFEAYCDARRKKDKRLDIFFRCTLFIFFLFSIIFLALTLYKNDFIAIARDFCVNHLDPAKNGGVLFALISAVYNLKRFFGFLVAGWMLLFLGSRIKMKEGVLSFAFVALVIADLFSAAPVGMQPMLSREVIHDTTPNVEYLKKDKAYFRFFVSPKLRKNSSFIEGKTYAQAIQKTKNELAADWPMLWGLYDAYGYDSIKLADYAKVMLMVETAPSPSSTRILDMLNVKYIV